MSLNILHDGLANACFIFSLVISGYGFWAFARNQGVGGSFLGVIIIGELLFLAQAGVGVALALQGLAPARGWGHYLYGVVQIISLPGLFAYLRGRDARREALMYAVLGLFLAGIALRAMGTAVTALP